MPQINWNEVITSRVLPAGFYNLRIANADLVTNSHNGLLQINLELRVDAPEVAKGKAHFEFLTLGKEPHKTIKEEWDDAYKEYAEINDPNFEDPRVQQRSKELKTFKRMLECSGFQLPASSDLYEVCNAAAGLVFTAHLSTALIAAGKRAGEEKNVIDSVLPYGSEEPRLDSSVPTNKSKVGKPNGQASAKPAMSKQTAIRPKPIMQPAESNGDATVSFFDDDDDTINF